MQRRFASWIHKNCRFVVFSNINQIISNHINYHSKYVSEPTKLSPIYVQTQIIKIAPPPIFSPQEIAASLAHHQLHSLELMPHHLQPIIYPSFGTPTCFGASHFGRYKKQVSSTSISRFMVGGRDFEMLPTSHLSISRAKVIGFLLAIIFQISAIVPTSK